MNNLCVLLFHKTNFTLRVNPAFHISHCPKSQTDKIKSKISIEAL